ncbi:TetR family transcriptional regulator [Kribbella sp. VKM Ac-2527]|uniref:TetR family transcriptional regulator n=1 Tax=Kribbella caucasensis TaxID=2512215 RepID=A0A4R6K9M0_9ACTN|nr:TetR family transcriptional regulator [Kribbella sp. VKM Ac-2527]TDO46419.1 TetR family transcriptional regulator [Kribbella sp. VKM Ac-2527]
MPTSRSRPTLTEQARRAQLIDVTVELVAEHGYGGTSLARIAEGAGITKAAVLYHFPSKDAVIEAAHKHVLDALVGTVGAAVEAAGPADRPAAYIRSMVSHVRDHPRHTRMITEAMIHTGQPTNPAERWGPLAQLLADAREARGSTSDVDLRTLAILTGGAIDAIIRERLADPGYDTTAAADALVTLIEQAT